ncbi:hypothetical protein D3C84_1036720 [compost metagenome]
MGREAYCGALTIEANWHTKAFANLGLLLKRGINTQFNAFATEIAAQDVLEQRHQLRHFQVVPEGIFRTDQAVLIVELKQGTAALAAQLKAHLEVDQ